MAEEKHKVFGLDVDDPKTPINLLKIIVILWLLSWIVSYLLFRGDAWVTRGQFGDSFGAINALFSGLGFGGIIYTIMLQANQLKLQRNELELTRNALDLTREELQLQREELRETRKEFEQQNTTIARQRFETSFYNLINLHQQVISNLKYQVSNKDLITGRDFFKEVVTQLKANLESMRYDEERYNEFSNIYNRALEPFVTHLNLYFGSLHNILYLIRTDGTATTHEAFYVRVITAGITEEELTIIIYHLAFAYDFDPIANNLREMEDQFAFFKTFAYLLIPDEPSFHDGVWDRAFTRTY
jgi:hypothetical protein